MYKWHTNPRAIQRSVAETLTATLRGDDVTCIRTLLGSVNVTRNSRLQMSRGDKACCFEPVSLPTSHARLVLRKTGHSVETLLVWVTLRLG